MTPLIGQHLLLDGIVAYMPNAGELHDILIDLAQALAVTVLEVTALWSGEGLVGIMLIAESHVAMHLRELPLGSAIDVFSCKPFSIDTVLAFLDVHLGFKATNMICLDRGQQ